MLSVTLKTVFVGLDYHSESIQVCVIAPEGKVLANRSCRNDWRTVVGVVQAVCGPATQVQAAIESCCGAADLAEELIAKAQWSVDLAHPGYVARIKAESGQDGLQRRASFGGPGTSRLPAAGLAGSRRRA